jgi:hypothetical protein
MAFTSIRFASVFVSAALCASLLPGISQAKLPPTQVAAAPAATAPSLATQLNLSEKQKNTIRGIYASRTRQINQVLTKDQQQKLQAQRNSGKKMSEALQSLNLNADQKKKILAIIQKTNQDIRSNLSQDQIKKLDAYLKQRHQNASQSAIE